MNTKLIERITRLHDRGLSSKIIENILHLDAKREKAPIEITFSVWWGKPESVLRLKTWDVRAIMRRRAQFKHACKNYGVPARYIQTLIEFF